MEKLKIKTNIRCVIIDDDKEACDRLETLLNNFDRIKIKAKIQNAEYGIKKIVELIPDIVFLDVEMPHKTGFEVVQEVRKQKINPTFIFVTGYNQYAIKAIHNAAFDYLLKPIDIDELKSAVERFEKIKEDKKQIKLPAELKKKYSLTEREIEIIKLLSQCKSSKEIAKILFLSKHTVDTHRRNILKKTGMRTTAELNSLIYNT